MTFIVKPADSWRRVPVRITYGPITIEVLEDPSHLRSFWRELGEQLDSIENVQTGLS